MFGETQNLRKIGVMKGLAPHLISISVLEYSDESFVRLQWIYV
jgi:hypothetical protein